MSLYLNARLRVHGMTRRWAIAALSTWLMVYVFAAIAIPLRYPDELRGTVVDSGLIVGLLLPPITFARLLDEGPAYQVMAASRRLYWVRCTQSSVLLLVLAAMAAAAATGISAVPFDLVVADSLLISSTAFLSVAMFGVALTWLLPLLLVFAYTAPGLVPWSANILYRYSLSTTTAWVALAVGLVAVLTYSLSGSVGIWARKTGSWREAAAPEQA